MIIPLTYKYLAAISKRAESFTNKPRLSYVSFQDDRLVATDGVEMAVVPVRCCEDDVPGPLPRDLKGGAIVAATSERVETQDGLSYARGEGVMPPWQKVLPEGEPEYTISLNAAALYRIAQAVCDPNPTAGRGFLSVKLECYGDKPVKVTPYFAIEDGAFGLLCTVREGKCSS